MTPLRPLEVVALSLVPIMFVSLAGAIGAGILQILWIGSPFGSGSATAAFALAFVFAGALLLSFFIAAWQECHHVRPIKESDPNEFGAEV
jgi:hypothetical protein